MLTEENTPTFEPPDNLDIEDIDCLDNDEEGVFLEENALESAQSQIQGWMKLKDEISKLSAALSNRRKKKKVLDTTIIKFMNENKIPHFDMSSGKLSMKTLNRKKPLNIKTINEKLNAIEGLSKEHKTQIISIINDRPQTQSYQLNHK